MDGWTASTLALKEEGSEDKDTDVTRSVQDRVQQKEEEAPGNHVASLLYSHTLPEHPRTREEGTQEEKTMSCAP